MQLIKLTMMALAATSQAAKAAKGGNNAAAAAAPAPAAQGGGNAPAAAGAGGAATGGATGGGGNMIPVVVGQNNQLTFTPNAVTANVGDTVQFQFATANHSVVAADQNAPCTPSGGKNAAVVNSGFQPVNKNAGKNAQVRVFNMQVTSTTPMFIYCSQKNHCQQGMVMTINAASNTDLQSFQRAASKVRKNVAANNVAGGTQARIQRNGANF